MADSTLSLDEACFLGNEEFINNHVPFDFSQSLLVHPVRIAMATVTSIFSHNSCDWFEGALKLLEFIHSRHEDVEVELFNTIIIQIKKSIVLCELSSNPGISKGHSLKSINKYFPSNDDPCKHSLIELFSRYKHKQHKIIEITNQECAKLREDLKKYFEVLEDQELPTPLSISDCHSYNNPTTSSSLVTDEIYDADGESEQSDMPTDSDTGSDEDYETTTSSSTEY